jgi:ABC-type protease/lipase transport system fused ATPase/permease subunit
MAKRRTDNIMAKRRRTDNIMAKWRRTNNKMAKRRWKKELRVINKSPHRKPNIDLQEPHWNLSLTQILRNGKLLH